MSLNLSPEHCARLCESLSKRETQVLIAAVHGGTLKHAARELSLAPTTVEVYVGRILTKMDVSRFTQAAVIAAKGGML